MSQVYDCIVLGLGGVGSAAAYHLARRGARVLGLEQFGPGHDRGSSHGETRIIRKAYFEHPDYVPLLHAAFDGWRRLEQATGRRLFDSVGLLICGLGDGEAVAGTRRAAQEHGLSLEVLTAGEARQRFPGFGFPDDAVVLFEREAGRLHVEACVQAHLDQARASGAELRFHEAATHWQADAGGVRVFTDRGIYAARSLIVTAGPWAARLLGGLGIPLPVRRKAQLWFEADPAQVAAAPCFYFEEPQGAFYGVPSPGGALLKVAEHTGGEAVDEPSLVERRLLPGDVAALQSFLSQRVPMARPQVVKHSVCLYTMSPDGHFLVDRHPEHPQVWFAAGLSGHGFKFAGVLGQALADLAMELATALPVDFLRLQRLAHTAHRE